MQLAVYQKRIWFRNRPTDGEEVCGIEAPRLRAECDSKKLVKTTVNVVMKTKHSGST